jgi:hypothetical protein
MTIGKYAFVAAIIGLTGSGAAQAQTGTLTLACKGTTMNPVTDEKPSSVTMGIIVNFTTHTVQGFGDPGAVDIPVRITAANDVTINFEGQQEILPPSRVTITGSIDRVTGTVYASNQISNTQTGKIVAR